MYRQIFRALLSSSKINCKHTRFASTTGLRKTCLHDFHLANGAKMVDFCGWAMPVQYKDSIPASHLHLRSSVGLFDVSHMLQTKVYGKDRVKYIESLVVGDIEGLDINHGTLTVFTNEKGGIKDDLIVNKTSDECLYIVSNAGCLDKDWAHMQSRAEVCRGQGMDVQVEHVKKGLLALQGPDMVKVLQPGVTFDLNTLPFMTTTKTSVFGIPGCQVTRCGYTGEDGVEISVSEENTEDLVKVLMSSDKAEVRLVGLGVRDSLRLEAGLCLYGNDLNESTTPVEASLTWVIGKRRRGTADFPGASIILDQIKQKPWRRRVGFISTGPPARDGTDIYDETGKNLIGELTSGCPSPTLRKNISMGYVKTSHVKVGTKVKFEIRNKKFDAEVVKMPFVPSNYFIPSKK